MTLENAATLFFFAWIGLLGTALLGWGINIFELVEMDFSGAVSGEMVLRILGVPFVPLGAVMGLFV